MQMLITDNARNRHVHNYALKIEHINLVIQLQVKCLLAILLLGCCQYLGLILSTQALQQIFLIVIVQIAC